MFKWIVAAALVVGGLFYMGTYNGLVNQDENVGQSYAQVQNVMQRQADLIPNLVETVKGQAGFEKSALTDIIQARNTAVRPIILANGKSCVAVDQPGEKLPKCSPDVLTNDPQAQAAFAEATRAMMNVNVNALREQYPTLRTNDSFTALMSQLEGSQNRISTERRKNQQAVQAFNVAARTFPGSVVAGIHGFKAKPYFEADAAAQKTPKVQF